MRRIAVVAILAVLLVSSAMAFAFQNEPKGFRKLNWGNTPTSTMKFMQDMNEFMKIYHDPSGENSIGSVNFYKIFYIFYVPEEGSLEFAGVTLFYNTEGYFDALETLCSAKFGPATDKGYQRFYWEGSTTVIHLKFDSIEERGWLSIDSTQLWNKYIERKETKEVEEAEGDW